MGNANNTLTVRVAVDGASAAKAQIISLADSITVISRSTSALQGVGATFGRMWMPQVFAPLQEIVGALKDARIAASVAGIGLGTLGTALAGVGAAVAAGVFGWKAYKAELQAAEAAAASMARQLKLNEALVESLRQNASRLPAGVADNLKQRLGGAAPDASIAKAKVELASIEQSRENLFQARRMSGIPDKEILKEFNQTFGKRIDELKALIAKPPLSGIQREATNQLLAVQQDPESIRNLERIADIAREAQIQTLRGFAKERAEAEAVFAKRSAELERLRVQNPSKEELQGIAVAWNAIAVERVAQVAEINGREQEARTKAMLDERAYWADKERRADEFYRREDERATQLAEQKRRDEASAILKDFRLTEVEKFNRLSTIGAAPDGPNPGSFVQQFQSGMAQLQNSWNATKNLATTVVDSIRLAVNGVSDAITGAILGTKTWGQVFAQVGAQIIASLVNVVVQWIANMTIIAAMKRLFGIKDNVQAAQSAAAWAPAAIAASIASYGAAAAIGTSAYLISLGTGTAVTAGMSAGAGVSGYAEGGRPPVGRVSIVGERGPELFVPNTAGSILPSSLSRKIVADADGLVSGGQASVTNEITFAPVMDPGAAAEYLREHVAAIAVQVFNRERQRYKV